MSKLYEAFVDLANARDERNAAILESLPPLPAPSNGPYTPEQMREYAFRCFEIGRIQGFEQGEKTRSQRMRDAGFTRRPSWRSLPSDAMDDFEVVALGQGKIEVGDGHLEGVPALIFGRNGTGVVGEPTQPNRAHEPGETLACVTFANVESLDVVLMKLTQLRAKNFGEAA
jgi:hypothetical protein